MELAVVCAVPEVAAAWTPAEFDGMVPCMLGHHYYLPPDMQVKVERSADALLL